MNVEIKGINFYNKGAQLMLLAILEELNNRRVKSISVDLRGGTFKKRRSYKLDHLLWMYSNKLGPLFSMANNGIKAVDIANIRSKFNFKVLSDIDLLLDASGFAYSDEWGINATRAFLKRLHKQKESGGKTVLLPQAFGPFNHQEHKELIQEMIGLSDIIFARDKISYDNLQEISKGKNEKIFLRPDFTYLVTPSQVVGSNKLSSRTALIVPNYRVIDKLKLNEEVYCKILTKLGNEAIARGYKVELLVHELKVDYELANKLAKELKSKVLVEEDPLQLKAIIGSSSLLIGSRYHAIINALSQNIPTIVLGWSHKYKELLREYSLKNLLIDPQKIIQDLDMLGNMFDDSMEGETKRRIEKRTQEVKRLNKSMWNQIFSIVNQ